MTPSIAELQKAPVDQVTVALTQAGEKKLKEIADEHRRFAKSSAK